MYIFSLQKVVTTIKKRRKHDRYGEHKLFFIYDRYIFRLDTFSEMKRKFGERVRYKKHGGDGFLRKLTHVTKVSSREGIKLENIY